MNTDEYPAVAEQDRSSASLVDTYRSVRAQTGHLCQSLETEDYVIQSMTDCSPTRWHLAHTTWFFETFVLAGFLRDYTPFHPRFAYLFNSYYVQAGERFSRPDRGMLSRPTVATVYEYRQYVDEAMRRFLESLETLNPSRREQISRVLRVGLNHEQQHQELMLTDIKHMFSLNPLYPVFSENNIPPSPSTEEITWTPFDDGIHMIGYDGHGFHYDHEGPRHRVFVEPFELASRPVTNAEYLDFLEDGGYQNQLLWLSDGWTTRESEGWNHPLYWDNIDGVWHEFTLNGLQKLDPNGIAVHLSYFEADAYARWSNCRLPTEFEWERAASGETVKGHFSENGVFHPFRASDPADGRFSPGLFGDIWEWTRSQYSPYPGYAAAPGALGEYNGKFMCNQFVLRGGSCATPESHIRLTYRNFFAPSARWQFAGIRLARDI